MAPTPQQLKAGQQKGGGKGGKKAVKARVRRYLAKTTEPQLIERGSKGILLMKGISCSQQMLNVLREIRQLQAPHAKLLTKNNQIQPFDGSHGGGSAGGAQSLEFLTTKNDAALFAVASHNKKRPNNLVLGRTFDHTVLDMVEFGILRHKSMPDYVAQARAAEAGAAAGDNDGNNSTNNNSSHVVYKKRIGSKPLLIFVGDLWQQQQSPYTPSSSNTHNNAQQQHNYGQIQNLLIDFYRGEVDVERLVLTGIDHVIVFTIAEHQQQDGNGSRVLIHQRTYYCQVGRAASSKNNAPQYQPVVMEPCGPDYDLCIRRSQWAEPDLYEMSRQTPQSQKQKKKRNAQKDAASSSRKTKMKNQSTNVLGETLGQLHVPRQHIDTMQYKKSKALRRVDADKKRQEHDAIEHDLAHEQRE